MAAPAAEPAQSSQKYTLIICASVVVAIVVAFRETALSMVEVWRHSETFSHCVVVLPIALWLAWRRREQLARVPVRPFWPGLVLVAGAGLLWMVGSLADANVVHQFALVLMIQSAVLSVLGLALVRALAFPLFFLYFAVPFGDALVPMLMDWTADVTVLAIKLTGVPVYQEGNYFVIPSGTWSVIEACSGIRYLLASLMTGTLYAHLMYRSTLRRSVFVAASVLVPILANWMRAYLIVMLGHLTDNRLAAGVDHLIYGWIFFGVVLLSMFWVGAAFREDGAALVTSIERARARSAAFGSVAWAALATVGLAVMWLPFASVLASSDAEGHRVLRPIEDANRWKARLDADDGGWQPSFSGQRAVLRQFFERDSERVVVNIFYYAAQTQGAELVNSENTLVKAGDPRWREAARGESEVVGAGAAGPVRTARLTGARGQVDIAWWYWVDGRTTTSDAKAKFLLAWSRLRLRNDDSAAVFLSTEPSSEGSSEGVLHRFASDMGASIERTLAAASEGAR